RVAAKYDCFSGIDGFECGTTNIDFSDRLHGEFSRLRSYRSTRLDVGASAVSVATESHAPVREKRIQLPETWLQGFMQVHSVMTLGLRKIRLAPIDVFNICRFLRRHRAKTSPRALRWQLRPGERTVVFVEPWDARIELSPASVYDGPKEETIRTWGRDRLQVLEPLLADAERIELYLAGHGLPLVVTVDMDLVVFTLALSGWTDNDWTGQSRFSLLSRRIDVKAEPLTAVYHALREKRYATLDELTSALDRDREEIRSCLSALCQAGRAMVDLAGGVYRHRDLLLTPFSAKAVLAEQKRLEEDSDPNAKAARQTVAAGHARITSRRPVKTGFKITGSVRGTDNERVRPLLHVDPEGLILDATCTCKFFRTHRLTKGPCEHVLALRLIHMDRLGKGE
ncbi:MAG: SWIM zinc finger family protein, partial [Myxococcota bacterium]